jgi:uncharacterized protein with HEPN domain
MLEDCTDIKTAVERVVTCDGMDADRLIRKAIIFSILDLGELTKIFEKYIDLPDSNIDCRGLKGMREIVAHRYQSMNSKIIWEVATE